MKILVSLVPWVQKWPSERGQKMTPPRGSVSNPQGAKLEPSSGSRVEASAKAEIDHLKIFTNNFLLVARVWTQYLVLQKDSGLMREGFGGGDQKQANFEKTSNVVAV